MNGDPRYAVDDMAVAATIASALQLTLNCCTIMVDVSDGAVTLFGEAENAQQRDDAEAIARRFCSRVENAVLLRNL